MIIRLDEEWTTYKKLLFLNAIGGGANEYEIEGNPVSFATNLARPLSAFTIPFLPVQSGTGDPSPSNVRPISGWSGVTAWRTGKNLLPNKKVISGNTIQFGVDTYSAVDAHSVTLQPGTYTLSVETFDEETTNLYVAKVGVAEYSFRVLGAKSITFTISEKMDLRMWVYKAGYGDVGVGAITSFQLEPGSTASPYTEYTGASYPVTFPAVGKNLLPNKKYQYSATQVRLGGENSTEVYKKLKAGTYTLSVTGNVNVQCYYTHNSVNTRLGSNGGTLIVTEADEDESYCFYCYKSGSLSADDVLTWQLEAGSAATAYEPYTNTVYGGTLDAVNGVLTVEWGLFTVTSAKLNELTTGWNDVYGAWARNLNYNEGITREFFNGTDTVPCSFASCVVNNKGITASQYRTSFLAPGWTSYEDFYNAVLSLEQLGTPLTYAAPLATPYEIQLDPITVQTLIGDNTIWTDTNGENTVKYLKKG